MRKEPPFAHVSSIPPWLPCSFPRLVGSCCPQPNKLPELHIVDRLLEGHLPHHQVPGSTNPMQLIKKHLCQWRPRTAMLTAEGRSNTYPQNLGRGELHMHPSLGSPMCQPPSFGKIAFITELTGIYTNAPSKFSFGWQKSVKVC